METTTTAMERSGSAASMWLSAVTGDGKITTVMAERMKGLRPVHRPAASVDAQPRARSSVSTGLN